MKATKWQRAVSLLLCLLMAMSFLTVTAPKAYAADDATAAEVTWAQLTSFKLADESYVYNDYTAKNRNTAWEIKSIYIDNYSELVTRTDRGDRPYAGEIQITVKPPVTVEDGTVTSTAATTIPTEIWVAKTDFSGVVTKEGTIAANNLKMVQDVAGTYKSSAYKTEVAINYGDSKIVYYSLLMTVDAGSGDTNTAPALKAGVDSSATATTTVDTAWTLNLADIFEDADNDPLSYKVSVNGAAPVDADANYSYTPTKAGETTTLVFTASDGKADSPTYTVTLTATATVEATWAQLTSFKLADEPYVYNDYTAKNRNTAWEIKSIYIDNYSELVTRTDRGDRPYAGEIQITVKPPVTVEDGTVTSTAATTIPTEIWVAKTDFSGVVTKEGTIAANNLKMVQDVAGTYKSSAYKTEVAINYGDSKIVYYSLLMTVDAGSGDTNTAPALKAGVDSSATATTTVDTAWTLNLADIFEDADNDPLSYKVSVNGADSVDADVNYSYTPTKAGETTTLVFTASDGKADSPTYTVTLTATATVEATWAQLTSFKLADEPYVYNDYTAKNRNTAWEIKSIYIDNYSELVTRTDRGDRPYAGEIQITVKPPVTVEDGTVTSTAATTIPTEIWVAKTDFSGVVTKEGTIAANNLKMVQDVAGTYKSSAYKTEVAINYGDSKIVYYSLLMTVDAGSGDTNTAPALKAGVDSSATATTTVDTAWTLNLADIFEDADNDPLSYKVSVNGAAPVDADANYSYTPTKAGETTTLVFTASDGKADSPTYTVTLTATAVSEVTYAITATVEGSYIISVGNKTSPMGKTEITVNGTSASEAKEGDPVVVKAIPQKYRFANIDDLFDAKFDHWEVVAGPTGLLSDPELKKADLEFNMPAETVSLKAVFVAVGSQVTLTTNNFDAGDVALKIGDWQTVASTYDSTSGQHKYNSVTRTVIAGAKVSAYIDTAPTANAGFKLDSWEIKNVTKNEIVVPEYVASNHPADGSSYMIPYFTVDGTSDYEIKAIFKAKDHGNVNVTVNDESMGTATAQIGAGEAATSINDVVEGTEVKLQAQPNLGYVFQGWSATYGSDNTQVVIANSTAAQTTFVMPATNRQPVKVVATFTEDPNYLSEECDLEEVALLDANGSPVGTCNQVGKVFTITLPADMDTTNLANMVLKLTYSKNAKVFRDGDTAAWNANGQACNMTLGTVIKFVVRSQKDLTEDNEGPTREYTITIQKAASPGTPTLSNGSATRTSKTGATVKFTSSEAGNYFYKVVDHGATAPTADEIMKSTTKGTASTGEITFTLSNLTEDARDIYIVVVSAAGGESAPLKVEIPAYGSGSETPDTGKFTITINAPKGGTITTNRTKADKGDEIIVTVKPDSGYQMADGSLTYSLAVAGGETVKIAGNRFTMPAGNVTITCKWETATTTVKGITGYAINGVAGAVNNSTNTITITMPRGTDVTKLTPVIATNGVKSLTPGNGVTVDFTNAVTYTAAMEDGSSKTYTVTVYVDKGTLADQFWDKLTDFATQVPWWEYAKHQQSTSKYPKYW